MSCWHAFVLSLSIFLLPHTLFSGVAVVSDEDVCPHRSGEEKRKAMVAWSQRGGLLLM
jgi:uncharacterized membrane protein YhhN